jgi:translation initiation factor 2B subunit (eIF-2B alpha/beta/delta family)
MTDAAIYSSVPDVDLALVGADAVGESGFVNKVGTRALSLTCREDGVPLFLLGTRSKWLPAIAWRRFLRLAEEPGTEVWKEAPFPLQVRNPYFELVPWGPGITLVAEDGLLRPEEAMVLIRAIETHPFLQ